MPQTQSSRADTTLAIAIECIHDTSRPVEAYGRCALMVGNDGVVLVVDER